MSAVFQDLGAPVVRLRGKRRIPGEPLEHPILFSGPMVRAIMQTGPWNWGSEPKTQTRRLLHHDGPEEVELDNKPFEMTSTPGLWIGANVKGTTVFARCPFGVVGDRLWVRETLSLRDPGGRNETWIYAADGAEVTLPRDDPRVPAMLSWAHHKEGNTCVSNHMPRFASRLLLEVTDIREQRLHDISEDDAKAEGTPSTTGQAAELGITGTWYNLTRRGRFALLWDRINADRSPWRANRRVWAVTFKRVEGRA